MAILQSFEAVLYIDKVEYKGTPFKGVLVAEIDFSR